MANFTEAQISAVWEKAKKIDGYDPGKYRQDPCGAWIVCNQYGERGSYGWEVDHALPESKGGDANPINIRAMQWENNESKSDDFPVYKSAVTSKGNGNIRQEMYYYFPKGFINNLKKIYPDNEYLNTLEVLIPIMQDSKTNI
jgi:hypothetical protein